MTNDTGPISSDDSAPEAPPEVLPETPAAADATGVKMANESDPLTTSDPTPLQDFRAVQEKAAKLTGLHDDFEMPPPAEKTHGERVTDAQRLVAKARETGDVEAIKDARKQLDEATAQHNAHRVRAAQQRKRDEQDRRRRGR